MGRKIVFDDEGHRILRERMRKSRKNTEGSESRMTTYTAEDVCPKCGHVINSKNYCPFCSYTAKPIKKYDFSTEAI